MSAGEKKIGLAPFVYKNARLIRGRCRPLCEKSSDLHPAIDTPSLYFNCQLRPKSQSARQPASPPGQPVSTCLHCTTALHHRDHHHPLSTYLPTYWNWKAGNARTTSPPVTNCFSITSQNKKSRAWSSVTLPALLIHTTHPHRLWVRVTASVQHTHSDSDSEFGFGRYSRRFPHQLHRRSFPPTLDHPALHRSRP